MRAKKRATSCQKQLSVRHPVTLLRLMRSAIRQMIQETTPPVATLYLHPWDLDPEQARLPLGRLSRFRTYAGLKNSQKKLRRLVSQVPQARFTTAKEVAHRLLQRADLIHWTI